MAIRDPNDIQCRHCIGYSLIVWCVSRFSCVMLNVQLMPHFCPVMLALGIEMNNSNAHWSFELILYLTLPSFHKPKGEFFLWFVNIMKCLDLKFVSCILYLILTLSSSQASIFSEVIILWRIYSVDTMYSLIIHSFLHFHYSNLSSFKSNYFLYHYSSIYLSSLI